MDHYLIFVQVDTALAPVSRRAANSARNAWKEGDAGRLVTRQRLSHLDLGLEIADLTQGEQRGDYHMMI